MRFFMAVRYPELPVLCQVPDAGISCAGCCVRADQTESQLRALVTCFTAEYQDFLGRNPSDEQKRAFFARRRSRGGNCPAVIFLNKERTQIGCAAHPQANDGADYRELVEHCVPKFFCTKGKQFMKGSGRAVAQILKEAEEHTDNPIARSLFMGEEVKTVA